MNYINAIPSAFKNMAEYIKLWCAVLINKVVHKLGNLAHHGATWAMKQTQPDLLEQREYGPDNGF